MKNSREFRNYVAIQTIAMDTGDLTRILYRLQHLASTVDCSYQCDAINELISDNKRWSFLSPNEYLVYRLHSAKLRAALEKHKRKSSKQFRDQLRANRIRKQDEAPQVGADSSRENNSSKVVE